MRAVGLTLGVASVAAQCCFNASTCIPRGHHLVFMGDSLTRYQYLSLVYGLRHGRPLEAPHIGGDTLRRYVGTSNPLLERTWPSWQEFYDGGSDGLAPYEVCDCFRADKKRIFENRYYWDPTCDVAVTYIEVFDTQHVWGHLAPQGLSSQRPEPKAFDEAFERVRLDGSLASQLERSDWMLSWIDAIDNIVRRLPPRLPTVVVLNMGWWHRFGADEIGFVRDLRRAALKVTQCAVWKTTTPSRVGLGDPLNESYFFRHQPAIVRDEVPRAVFPPDFVFPAGDLVSERVSLAEFADNLHFTPSVYNYLNARLLAFLHDHPDCLVTASNASFDDSPRRKRPRHHRAGHSDHSGSR